MDLVCPQKASAPSLHYSVGDPRPIQGGASNSGPCTQALSFSICPCLALPCRFCHPPEVLWVWVVQMIRSEEIQRSPTFLWGVVESLNHIWLFVTTWTAPCQASLSFYISQSLLKLVSIVSMRPSNHLILSPLLLLLSVFPRIRVFSSESAVHIRWPKYWSFSISPSSDYSGLIFFRIDWFDFLEV